MLTLAEIEEACNQTGEALRAESITREALLSLAQTFESLSYDLVALVMQSISTHGESGQSQMARAAVHAMDQRLTWVQQHRADALTAETQEELRAAWQSALDVLYLLRYLPTNPPVRVRSEIGETSRS